MTSDLQLQSNEWLKSALSTAKSAFEEANLHYNLALQDSLNAVPWNKLEAALDQAQALLDTDVQKLPAEWKQLKAQVADLRRRVEVLGAVYEQVINEQPLEALRTMETAIRLRPSDAVFASVYEKLQQESQRYVQQYTSFLLREAQELAGQGEIETAQEKLAQAKALGARAGVKSQFRELQKQISLWHTVSRLTISATAKRNSNSPLAALQDLRRILESVRHPNSGLPLSVRGLINELLALENSLHQEEVLKQSKQLIADLQDVALKNRLVSYYLLDPVEAWYELALRAARQGFIRSQVELQELETAYEEANRWVNSYPQDLEARQQAQDSQSRWLRGILRSIEKRCNRAKELKERGAYQEALMALEENQKTRGAIEQKYPEIVEHGQIQQALFKSRDLQLELNEIQDKYLKLEALLSQVRPAYIEGNLDHAENLIKSAELLDQAQSVKLLWLDLNNLKKLIERGRQKERRSQVEREMNKAEVGLHLARTAQEIGQYLQALVSVRGTMEQLRGSESVALHSRYSELVSQLKKRFEELEKNELFYQVELSLPAAPVPIGGEVEVIISLRQTSVVEEADYLLNIPVNEVDGDELNLILDAPGFQFLQDHRASLSLLELGHHKFRLLALRPGKTQITLDIYQDGNHEGTIKQAVQVEPKGIKDDLFYQVQLALSAETVPIGGELEVTISLQQASVVEKADDLLNIPANEVDGYELNLILDAPGFKFQQDNAASLPLLELGRHREPQSAKFRLLALCPSDSQIRVDIYQDDNYKGTMEQAVEVAGINENAMVVATPLTLQPRPVAQADYILQVDTCWHDATDKTEQVFSFHYHLTTRLPNGDVEAHSERLSTQWMDTLREEWQQLLGETKGGVVQRPCLVRLGRYLCQTLLPQKLQKKLWAGKGRSLLLITDQNASLPWELLHNGNEFLAERLIIGRWLRELPDLPPYEFPVDQISVAYYENAALEYQWWVNLIEPSGSLGGLPLRDGLVDVQSESLRGLHLLRYGCKISDNNGEAPVHLADDGQFQPIKLKLRRNCPLVSLSYVSAGRPELTNLAKRWAPTFVHAGCSAFVGPLWTVQPAVEAAFISGFYHYLWTGWSLGEAFQAGRDLARAAVPESLDWLAYTLFGDPMARPYRPVKGQGYAVVEPIGQSKDDPLLLLPGEPLRFRVSLRREPPIWHKSRIMEIAEELSVDDLQVQVIARDVELLPNGHVSNKNQSKNKQARTLSIAMKGTSTGHEPVGFTVLVPPKMTARKTRIRVFFVDGEQPIHSLTIPLKVGQAKGY